jgi:parallel beta-helix repeat protein
LRENEKWCLSSSGGGPQVDTEFRKISICLLCFQIGQPMDKPVYNVTIENLTAENTGDDSIALFNVADGGLIQKCTVKDSYARGILLRSSPNTTLTENTLVRCHVLYETMKLSIVESLFRFLKDLLA